MRIVARRDASAHDEVHLVATAQTLEELDRIDHVLRTGLHEGAALRTWLPTMAPSAIRNPEFDWKGRRGKRAGEKSRRALS